ncbi:MULTISPECIES: MFS transporter [Streptomyces]|uniref:Major facilitator transporter n=1 Tax=Streptomyces zinciresistens K42 TaxID=700597 RepID=G2GDD4_9ACTN|nr:MULTISPECIES: MFS transporter [Streptomyces]EGX58466.1 major facilitator transporter [Streptomyces zinciresistens K42]MDT9695836.1 MFS transporter [Streptomyces sp. P17]
MTALAAERSAPPRTDRRLLTGAFAALGVVMAVWGSRMPALQAAAHLTAGELAVVLLGAAVGMVAGLQVGGRLADRHGPSRLLVGPTVIFGAVLVVLGQCRTLPSLVLGAAVFGLAHGLLDVGANTCAVHVERAYRRKIMSSLHCSYSVGALGGAALAATTTWLPYDVLFTTVGAVTVLAALATVPVVRAAQHLDDTTGSACTDDEAAPSSSRATVWLLGALAAGCLLGEGAAVDWSAVHLHSLHSGEATAAAAYALYSAAMATGRLFGDRLTTRYGATTVVRGGAALAAAGLGAGLAIGTVPAALLGWTALGLGLSTAVPSLISAAGRGGPRAVAAVAATGYLGLLTGPAAIGALASLTSVPAALALPVLLAAAVALAAHRALEAR